MVGPVRPQLVHKFYEIHNSLDKGFWVLVQLGVDSFVDKIPFIGSCFLTGSPARLSSDSFWEVLAGAFMGFKWLEITFCDIPRLESQYSNVF